MSSALRDESPFSLKIFGLSLGANSALASLFLLAFIPKLILALVFLRYPIALDDMFQYDMLARSIVSGNGYRWYTQADIDELESYLSRFVDLSTISVPEEGLETTFRAPGYPFFLSIIYRLVPSEDRFAAARLVQAFLSAMMAPLVGTLAFKLKMKKSVSYLAGLGMAFYPILSFYPVGLASENLFIPLTLLSVLFILHASETQKWRHVILAGLTTGLSILTRSILAPFLFLAVIWYWQQSGKNIRRSLVLLGIALGMCLPWSIRNTRIMGSPTFVETSMGYNLFVGYHPEGNGAFVSEVAIIPMTMVDDVERNTFSVDSAKAFIRQDPFEAIWRVIRRSAFFVGFEDRELTFFYAGNYLGNISQPWLLIAYLFIITPWIVVAVFGSLSLIRARDHHSTKLVFSLLIVYITPHILILSEPRFHLALVPILLPYAAQGVANIGDTVKVVQEKWVARASLGILVVLWIWSFSMNLDKLIAVMGPGGNELYLPY
jgi:hypothetical protein